jgi:rubrerythrin
MVDFTRPFPGKNPGDEITEQEAITSIRLALCAEEEAVQLYNSIAEYVSDEKIKKLVSDIATEEQVHIGELQKLLDTLETNEVKQLAKGKKEAEDKIGGDTEEEPEEEEPEEEPEEVKESVTPDDIAKWMDG